MEKEPEGNYGLTFALVKNCSKEEFKADMLGQYEYEVIGGLHNMTAAKALNSKYPENVHFHGRHSRIYCGLASRHNITDAMHHNMSFVEEVSVDQRTF